MPLYYSLNLTICNFYQILKFGDYVRLFFTLNILKFLIGQTCCLLNVSVEFIGPRAFLFIR